VTPLSRRDRAALRLAYEVLLRDDAVGHARRALSLGGPMSRAIEDASYALAAPLGMRILRARLALLLRVVLRVDRGDFGALRCEHGARTLWRVLPTSEWPSRDEPRLAYACPCLGAWRPCVEPWPLRVIRPLWESAPPHDGRRG
jgi:hypothetical protein